MNVLDGDHYSVFYNNFEPIDDDLEGNISLYEEITFPEGKELHSRNILKIIDDLKRRQRAYSLWK